LSYHPLALDCEKCELAEVCNHTIEGEADMLKMADEKIRLLWRVGVREQSVEYIEALNERTEIIRKINMGVK
jgi:RPA family protein